MDNLIKDFYKIVNSINNKIIDNKKINILLFHCKYNIFNSKTNDFTSKNNKKFPLIFCLGGMAYQTYYDIISKYYHKIPFIFNTKDYDLSFSLISNTDEDIKIIKSEMNEIFKECIKNYQFEFIDETKRKYKLNKNNFVLEILNKGDRLQIKVNCLLDLSNTKRQFHILELCFWYNGKISDIFTINDFKKDKLFMYIDNNNYIYYLLPLEKLVKTTYYAILDNYERSNFDKCKKYLDRIRYIKLTFDKYKMNEQNIKLLDYIYSYYYEKIYNKYKIMYDYPFILSRKLSDVKNNEIIKCVKRELRTEQHSIYENKIKNYITKCEKNSNKLNIDEITEEDTDFDLKNIDLYKFKYVKYKNKYTNLKNKLINVI